MLERCTEILNWGDDTKTVTPLKDHFNALVENLRVSQNTNNSDQFSCQYTTDAFMYLNQIIIINVFHVKKNVFYNVK